MSYIERIVDTETGKTSERAYTSDEVAAVEQAKADAAQAAQEAADKAAAREAVLRKLGLTDDDLTALGL